ncbi:NAD(P)/FAD-dependent oxidoreductase [Mycolicibacterium sp.]|uniref:NAD(P)/FAD-dependent oxidoreductase n=1 Tax=Mycolicibacterium sp. TaxID=2320850 RepID=UPI001A25838A|nr:NAD(P)/FAD-dependent oxidoreductase [Mycolicibacterium sp.]MBJ7339278.1 FAD-dependent oxidoreductase [Mycolicibacterium sp.]
MTFDDTEVLIIGAGLAGLRCARVLRSAGRDVRVWEASDVIGGRVRTDEIDGFRCDRGFQVLNPAYSELKHATDVSALRLQPFGAGVSVRRDTGSAAWVHPLRAPTKVPAMLVGGGLGPRDVLAVGRWAAAALRPRALKAHSHHDTSLRSALDRAGVSGELRRVIDKFLAGVVLEDRGVTSNAFALLLVRMFVLGVPALPADGMQALPRQLGTGLDALISLQRKVTELVRDGSGWRASDGTHGIRAQHVVVATDPVTAARLAGVSAPPMHGVVTDWWAADEVPAGPPMLWVDGRSNPLGPVLNTAVISAAAPTYAPEGRHLIAASALMAKDGGAPEEAVMRAHAADILGGDGTRWRLLVRHLVPQALPEQPAPLSVRRPVRTPDGMWVCGDHRDTASIQGALVSGRRTAEAILNTAS